MNIRVIVRSLLKDWRFSLFVVVIVGVGIALNTATFTIADGILFEPLAVRAPERLVRVFVKAPWGDGFWQQISYPAYREIREQARSFQDVAAFANDSDLDVSIAEGEPLQAKGAMATGNFFRTVGVSAQRGRVFGDGDTAVAVISDDFARAQFRGSEPIGAVIRVNTVPLTIIGVAPARFHGVAIDVPTDIWIPVSMWPVMMRSFERLLDKREIGWIAAVGRLKDGVSVRAAEAEVRTIAARQAAIYKEDDPKARLYTANEQAFDAEQRPKVVRLATLFGIFVAIVLTIACVNAGSLQLVRGERRQRELAIRAAVGASRGRLLRELATEGAILAVAAGALGLALAHALVTAILAWAPDSFPLMLHASRPVLDARVALVVIALTTIGSLACGLVPALRVTRVDLQRSMRGDRAVGRSAAIRGLLVVVQIALSVVVLIAAGLMIRTLRNMQNVDPGFDTRRAAAATLNLSRQGYNKVRAGEFFDRLSERLRATPGVTDVAIGKTLPLRAGGMLASVTIPGYAPPGGQDPRTSMNAVAPGYFAALGVPLLHGRDFNAQDRKDSEPVMIVNEVFARQFWPSTGVVDRRVGLANESRRIVGVVKSTMYEDYREDPLPVAYIPHTQLGMTSAEIALRTSGDAEQATAVLRDAIRALDPNLPIHDLETLRERVGAAWQREEALASMLAIFGALALLLAAVGLFSVISYRTETRRKEIGVRIAVGAGMRDVVALVLRHTGALLLAGIAAGLAISLFAGKLAESFLYAVTPFDTITFASVALVFLAVGLLAAALPARRAARMDAAQVLRAE